MIRKAIRDSSYENARQKADADFYKNHREMKGKQISRTDPNSLQLRREWMDLYIKHGGTINGGKHSPETQNKKIDLFDIPDKYGTAPITPELSPANQKLNNTLTSYSINSLRYNHASIHGAGHVFDIINKRLKKLNINLVDHINTKANGEPILTVESNTLDGIEFEVIDDNKLKNTFYNSKDSAGRTVFASIKDSPDNLPLKGSFLATKGTGWRETWRPISYSLVLKSQHYSNQKKNLKLSYIGGSRMPFGSNKIPIRFTSLHCSIESHKRSNGIEYFLCSIHIDKSGFVADFGRGIALTPDFYQHLMDELLVKTKFRNFLVNRVLDNAVINIINSAIKKAWSLGFILTGLQIPRISSLAEGLINRTTVVFPNTINGYAGMGRGSWRKAAPIGVSIDLSDLSSEDNSQVQVNYVGLFDNEKIFSLTLSREF